MKRPIIALTPQVSGEPQKWWMKPDYMLALERAGAIGVMLPPTEQENELRAMAEHFDGFLFTGGPDLDPVLYGQERMEQCGSICPRRDEFELKLMKLVLELDKPVLGICRGLQVLNVALGGTLYQDIPTQIPSELEHRVLEEPLARFVHPIRVDAELPFGDLPLTLEVNSRHHQAIRDPAPGLTVRARADDGIVEAVTLPGKRFVQAVQWHPENFENELSHIIFRDFVNAARQNSADNQV